MYAFDIAKPATLAEAVQAMKTGEAQALSGGQTLIPTLKQRLAAPSVLVSLAGVGEMKGVSAKDGVLEIGGAATHREVAGQRHYPGLAELAGRIGDPAVRNRGTIGGSLANNDPSACYPAALLASGGSVKTDRREIAADDFFQGMFATALEADEIITAVRLRVPEASNYQKFLQPASRFALVGVFVARHADGVRVAVTGASEGGVFRWTEAERALSADFSAGAVSGLKHPADGMISDIHGTPEYRAHLIGVMTHRAVAAAS